MTKLGDISTLLSHNLEDLLKKSLNIRDIDLLTFAGVSALALKSLKEEIIYV